MSPYKIRHYLNIVLEHLSLIFPVIIAVVVLFLSVYSYRNYQTLQDQTKSLADETEKIKVRVDSLKNSRSLLEDQIDEINQMFFVLIPDNEDFFSIIYALEKISQESGFTVDQYSVNFSSPSERLAIDITGNGDSDTFIKLLKTYPFSGGRFVTSEKIDFSNAKFSNTKVTLTFYSKKVVINEETIPTLTNADIDFVKKIKNKIKVELKNNQNAETGTEYPTEVNPF